MIEYLACFLIGLGLGAYLPQRRFRVFVWDKAGFRWIMKWEDRG
jgi:hypothetical protein